MFVILTLISKNIDNIFIDTFVMQLDISFKFVAIKLHLWIWHSIIFKFFKNYLQKWCIVIEHLVMHEALEVFFIN
jgi:hypothetical protein